MSAFVGKLGQLIEWDGTINNRRECKAIVIKEFKFDSPPGTCLVDSDINKLSFACPGCGRWGGVIAGHPKPPVKPSWDIIGGKLSDPTTLTLSPSIHCIGCCGWHGYLKNGVFESC
jgi:hypothetical protein